MASTAPAPLVPPRPSRASNNDAASASAPVPAIPPRPSTKPRSTPEEGEAEGEQQQQEPELHTISPSTELHQPVARVPYRTPVRKNTGIPQIGKRVPMYPNAGDVQAPTPAATPGGGRKAHVYKEEWEMDEGAYGSHGTPRVNPHARSVSDLNQSVAQGLSAPETSTPVPDEEIGYLASEHYARVISPPESGTPVVGFSDQDTASLARAIGGDASEDKDSELAIHLDPPTYHHHLHNHHPHRIPSSRPGTRPKDANDTETEIEREQEYPILAADEVLKRAGGGYMAPAISPPLAAWRPESAVNSRPHSRPQSTHPGMDDDDDDDEDADVEPVRLSGHGFESKESLVRESLESGERPEPLFPESDDEAEGKETPGEMKVHEKPKRPGMPESIGSSGGHRFPSKDVWEEAPEFSQLEATVSSTPPPKDTEMTDEEREADRTIPKRTDGKPETGVKFIHGQPNEHYVPGDEVEFERKQKDALKKTVEYRHHVNREGRDDGLEKLLKRGSSTDDPDKLGASSNREKVKRFPSNDIWEDVPPSLELSAELTYLPEEEYSATEPKDRATTSGTTKFEDPNTLEVEKRPTTGAPIEASSRPEIPARPAVPSARPAPKVPLNRPVRPVGSLVAKSPSADAVPTLPKSKPSVPPRTGGKIAALKAGFLSDLDNRLKLGPMAPKKTEEEAPASPEKEKEKEVLADVRKGRAKGPRGRKLPTATTTEAAAPKEEQKPEIMSVGVWSIWSVGDQGDVEVLTDSPPPEKKKAQEDKKEKKEDSSVPAATTSTLPGVTGTGAQTVPSVSDTQEKDLEVPATTAAEEKEEKGALPTVIPAEEHPGDAAPATADKKSDTDAVGEAEKGRVDEAAEVAVAGGDVSNTEGDARVEV
ncbi:hypothetical protein P167DRAFT_553919 [Morchella conica CCBAS932]|uniref:Altered inheritance of mitochondria protein 21 n=1 Tax=Morchella conica CCBAS932 TaxID=1392247 RepID=A0A3N4KQR9_9PEZI|nr:hypothetical protein P167DRAFT_553919 [Morchella conica CCBAS932]